MRRGMEGGGRLEDGDAGGRRFSLDRSKLRVLLCDKDPKSSQEVLRLLNNCSYQVTTVRTARQVIDLLTNGNEIDIVLCEVDLPIAKGLKMLKCIARKKDLRRIPIIMMSSRDEVSVVVRCLRLGAADYLVKPLRTNELLNLWTHSWRRRHMLVQAEKDIFNQSIGMIFSDHSDANTNSTTFLSEDTDDKIRTRDQEVTLLDQKDREFDESRSESDQNILSEDNTLQHANHPVCSGKLFSWPTKMDLKVGQSSAFITYVKSRAPTSNSRFIHEDPDATPSDLLNGEQNLLVQESHSLENSIPSMLQVPTEFPVIEPHSSLCKHLLQRTEGQPMFHVPFYLHGQPSSMQGLQGTSYDLQMQNQASLIHQYNVLPMMQHFAYHPVAVSLPSEQRPQPTNGLAERRAAALMKFKQKKKERCYDKKVRYINRKRLAEKRPRVRGQFVRQVTDVDVQVNDSPAMNDYDSDEELELDSSTEHDTY